MAVRDFSAPCPNIESPPKSLVAGQFTKGIADTKGTIKCSPRFGQLQFPRVYLQIKLLEENNLKQDLEAAIDGLLGELGSSKT